MSNNYPELDIPRPDAGSAHLVQQTVAHLAGRELELTEGFYNHLFAMLPEVRAMFPDDMADQRVRLLKALLATVDSLHDPAGMEASLQQLGEVHYYRGLQDDQYQYVAHALVRTIRDILPGDWSTWLSSAWISVYSWMIAHMVVGAKRARAREEGGEAPGELMATQAGSYPEHSPAPASYREVPAHPSAHRQVSPTPYRQVSPTPVSYREDSPTPAAAYHQPPASYREESPFPSAYPQHRLDTPSSRSYRDAPSGGDPYGTSEYVRSDEDGAYPSRVPEPEPGVPTVYPRGRRRSMV